MVRIINGEIVQDNDPRLKQVSAGGSSGASMRPGRNNVRDVFSSSYSESIPGSRSQASGSTSDPNLDPRIRAQQQQKVVNPLDMAATALGIQDRFITIPAVQQAGLTETRVGLIYVGAVGLACFLFGYKAGLVAVGGYVLWKKSETSSQNQQNSN